MKLLLTLNLFFFIGTVSAQDTTNHKMIGVSFNTINFFKSDSTDLDVVFFDLVTLDSNSSGHAIFINPEDSLIYGVIKDTSGRGLYQFNPFTGSSESVFSFTSEYIHTADIGENGNIYAVNGNGGGTPGLVYTYNLYTGIEDSLYVYGSSQAGNSRAIEYNPIDSSLYIYEGNTDSLFVYDLNTGIETKLETTGLDSYELHGAFYNQVDDNFTLSSYGGDILSTDNTYLSVNGSYASTSSSILDICTLDYTISADSNYLSICPTDSVKISLLYEVNSFFWYKNNVLLPLETDSAMWISEPGIYQAILEINTTGSYFWSEPIHVAEKLNCSADIEKKNLGEISIYPNPTKSTLFIDVTSMIDVVSISLISITGQVIMVENNPKGIVELNMKSQSPGIYFISLKKSSETITKKIIRL